MGRIDRSITAEFLDALSGLDIGEPRDTEPFLSVVMRTRGDRLEPLTDALVCLMGQRDQDFDVILAVHDPAPGAVEGVTRIVADEVPALAPRIRVITCVGGTLSTPLNAALELCRGAYVAVFDDDDLLLANWVAVFHEAARARPGRVVRSVVVDQACVARNFGEDGRVGLVASGPIQRVYSEEFSLLEHLVGGATPFHGFAFPRRVIDEMGLRFDDGLRVHEDWDFQLRAIRFLGVASVPVVTSIYRRHPESDSLASHPSPVRDAIFDTLVHARVDGEVFPIDGDELVRFRLRSKVVDDMWHQKESVNEDLQFVLGENAALRAEIEYLSEFRGLLRRLAGTAYRRARARLAR